MRHFAKPIAALMVLLMLFSMIPVAFAAEIEDNAFRISNVQTLVDTTNNQVICIVTTAGTPPADGAVIKVLNSSHSALELQQTQQSHSAAGDYTFTFPIKDDVYNDSYSIGFGLFSADGSTSVGAGGSGSFVIGSGEDRPEWDGNASNKEDLKLQTPYDITLLPTPIAQDDKDGNVDLKLHLSYKGEKDFSEAKVSYFRIEPQVSGDTSAFPFEMELSTYAQTMADLVVELDEEKNVSATYFHFPLKVKKDAVNGYYPITFKVYHLYWTLNLQEADPVETTITTYVEIRNGKKASGDSEAPSADPSTAILLLEGYSVEPQEIRAGDEFDLTLRIRNTSDRTVTDVKSTLTEANKTIMPVSGASSFFIEKIKAGETYEHTIRLKATASAGVDPVELTLQNAFVQQDMGKTSSDTFILPVIQVSNLSMDPPNYPVEMYLGDSFNLMMSMYNKGKSRLYNVSVYLDSESMTADENYYAGNMESGSSKTYDVMVTPNMEGQISGDIVVTFEDAEGNVTEKRTPITLNVATMDWMTEDAYPIMPDDVPADTYPSQSMPPLWVWFAVGAGGLAAGTITIVLIVRAKKRKNALVEDDDEMD